MNFATVSLRRAALALLSLAALASFAGCTAYGDASRSGGARPTGAYLQTPAQSAAAPSRDFDFDI